MIFPFESFASVQSSAVRYPGCPCHDLLLDGAGTLDWAETRAAVVWDDAEERRYRDWVREKVQQNQEADFEELRDEESFRQKLREETEKRKTHEVRNIWRPLSPRSDS